MLDTLGNCYAEVKINGEWKPLTSETDLTVSDMFDVVLGYYFGEPLPTEGEFRSFVVVPGFLCNLLMSNTSEILEMCREFRGEDEDDEEPEDYLEWIASL